jgi:hypothetical protein
VSRIVLAGGTGFLGDLLVRHFAARGDEVVVLTRRTGAVPGARAVRWDARTPGRWTEELDGADALINLCGRSVNCRYHAANRREILDSRLAPTRVLGEAVFSCRRPPPVWLNAASATIYRHAEDRPMTEDGGEIGEGFSVSVCQQWETAFFGALTPETRKVALRTGMVLGTAPGGVLAVLRGLVRAGLGGTMGHGRQFVSWLHAEDFVRSVDGILGQEALLGPLNITAPEPVPNRELMAELRRVLRRPFGLPATRAMLEIGAVFLGTETELILKSRRVVPERLLRSGFVFRFPRIGPALEDLLG